MSQQKKMPKKEVNDHSSTDGSCIIMLTDAEKRAREVIDAAKKRKNGLIKKAKDESSQEIEAFKKELESNFANVIKQYSTGQDTVAIKVDRDREIKKIELISAFKSKSPATLKFVINSILNVDPKCHENLII